MLHDAALAVVRHADVHAVLDDDAAERRGHVRRGAVLDPACGVVVVDVVRRADGWRDSVCAQVTALLALRGKPPRVVVQEEGEAVRRDGRQHGLVREERAPRTRHVHALSPERRATLCLLRWRELYLNVGYQRRVSVYLKVLEAAHAHTVARRAGAAIAAADARAPARGGHSAAVDDDRAALLSGVATDGGLVLGDAHLSGRKAAHTLAV